MLKRLLVRGETSGRADDNMESIKKRFKTFVDTSMPVVDEFETQGRVVKINAVQEPDEVTGMCKRRSRLAALSPSASNLYRLVRNQSFPFEPVP